jgi:hypothetical protein
MLKELPCVTLPKCVTIFLHAELGPIQGEEKSCNGALGMTLMCARFKAEMVRIKS